MHRTGVTGAGSGLVYKKGLEASTKKCVEMERTKHQSRSAPSGTANVVTARNLYECNTCQRSFRRRQDTARHKCVTTRPKSRVCPNYVLSLRLVCHSGRREASSAGWPFFQGSRFEGGVRMSDLTCRCVCA